MLKIFKRGDHVAWNSEAGGVRGVILNQSKKVQKVRGRRQKDKYWPLFESEVALPNVEFEIEPNE